MTDNQTSFSVIRQIPDDNTSEAIAYGSEYEFAKASRYFWDETEDEMGKEMRRLMRQIIDPDFALMVLRHRPDMIRSKQPPVNDPDQIRDLWTLRQIIAWGTGREILDVYRTENELYASMKGVRDYSEHLLAQGVSQEMWKAATLGLLRPIEYETVRTVRDRDEDEARREMSGYMDDPEARAREVRRFESEFTRYLDGELGDDSETPSPADRITIYREVPEDGMTVPEVPFEQRPIGADMGRMAWSWVHGPCEHLETASREAHENDEERGGALRRMLGRMMADV